jgi:hypothetical protein
MALYTISVHNSQWYKVYREAGIVTKLTGSTTEERVVRFAAKRPNLFNSPPCLIFNENGGPYPWGKVFGLNLTGQHRLVPTTRLHIRHFTFRRGMKLHRVQGHLSLSDFTHSTNIYSFKIGRYDLKISLIRHIFMAKIQKLSYRKIALFWDPTLCSLASTTL